MTREEFLKMLDVTKDGKVDVNDALEALNNNAKDALYVGGTVGVFAGALLAFVLCMVF